MNISFSRLRTTTIADFAKRVIDASEGGKYKVVESNPLLEQLRNQYNEYKDIYVKQTFSGLGKSVAEADEERDKLFNGIKTYLKGYLAVPLLPNYEKAQELYEVLKLHDLNLDKKPYADETALLVKLIDALNSEANKEKLKALALESTFEELKTKNNNFIKLMAEQNEANAELRKTTSATSLRKGLERALKNYLALVTAMKDQDSWNTLYLDLNEVVKTIKNS